MAKVIIESNEKIIVAEQNFNFFVIYVHSKLKIFLP